MPFQKTTLAVLMSVSLAIGGCSTLKTQKAEEAAAEQQNNPQGYGVQDKDANSVETNTLSEQERLKAAALAEKERAAEQQRVLEQQRVAQEAKLAQEKAQQEATQRLATRLVHFDYDSAELSSEDLQTLQAHAQYLSNNANAKVLLAGHADERGTREYNMALGEKRADAVQAFFVGNGVKSTQLDTVSYGKEKPLNTSSSESAWAENRRVEINYQQGAPR